MGLPLVSGKMKPIDSRYSVKQPTTGLHWGLGPKYSVIDITFKLVNRFLKMGEVSF